MRSKGIDRIEQNRVGACHLLCRCNDRVFKIRLYRPCSLFDLDFALFDCGNVAFRQPNLTRVSTSRINAGK
jgi:hypothetical protein